MQPHPRFLQTIGLVALFGLGNTALAESSWTPAGTFEDRIAVHMNSPRDLSSQFQMLYVEEKFQMDPWSAVISGRGWSEAAYAADSGEYPSNLISNDSQDISFRDLFVQYKKDSWFARVGQQQVVWGEAFGFFYSDIVNPKDLRDGGFRDFEAVRRPIPMVNIKYTLDQVSLQGLYIVKPYFNQVPLPGSDFAFPFKNYLPVSQVSIIREDSLVMEPGNDDYGGRVSYREGRLDTSAFVFSYLDRTPYYVVGTTSQLPSNIVLREQHSRVVSVGVTGSYDLDGYVLRFEGLQTRNRLNPILQSNTLGTFSSPEYIYVFGVDFPTWNKLSLGVQYSDDWLNEDHPGMFRSRDQNLFSAHLSRPVYLQQTIQSTLGYAPYDGSVIVQFEYDIPATDQIEWKFGADYFDGSNLSQYGEIRRASRVYTSIKFWFKG